MFNFKKNNLKIEFVSTVFGLTDIQIALPKSSRGFTPSWWKRFPKQAPYPETQTVKVCPGLPDFFSEGYVIPMWCDATIQYIKETNEWVWSMGRPEPSNPFVAEPHSNAQMLDHVTPSFKGVDASYIFKFVSPWRIITPKGYSVIQIPMFYEFNKEFSVAPGVIHTDVHHEVNPQIMYHGTGEPIFIKMGTPLFQIIPFKRTEYSLEIREQTKKDIDLFAKNFLKIISLFPGRGAYKKMFKELGE